MSEGDFVILGAGAIGSILGAHLAHAGHSVVMLARGRRAADIERNGLRIKGLIDLCVPVRVVRDPLQLSGNHILIVAMKTPGTAEALRGLPPEAICAAFSLQNGPGKNQELVEVFGSDRVLGALADTSGEMLADGHVLFTRNVNVLLGELTGAASARAQRIARMIDESGVRAEASLGIVSLEWTKFCAWAGLMAMSITTRAETWKYLTDVDTARLTARLIREVGSLARALGVALLDKAVLPVARICAGSEEEAVQSITKVGMEFKANAPHHRMSSLQDLAAGRPLEIEATLGYSHRQALRLGLSLPLLDAFYHLGAAINRMHREAT